MTHSLSSLLKYTCGSETQLNIRISGVILKNLDTRTLTVLSSGRTHFLYIIKASQVLLYRIENNSSNTTLILWFLLTTNHGYRIILTNIIEINTKKGPLKSILFNTCNPENDHSHVIHTCITLIP